MPSISFLPFFRIDDRIPSIRGEALKERFDRLRGVIEPAAFLSSLLDQYENAGKPKERFDRLRGVSQLGTSGLDQLMMLTKKRGGPEDNKPW